MKNFQEEYKKVKRTYWLHIASLIILFWLVLTAFSIQIEGQDRVNGLTPTPTELKTIILPSPRPDIATPTPSPSDLPDRGTCWDGSIPGQYACPKKPVICGEPGQPACSPLRISSNAYKGKGRATGGNGIAPPLPIPELTIKIESSDYVITYWLDGQGNYTPISNWSGKPGQDGFYHIYVPEAMYLLQVQNGFGLYAVESDGLMLDPFELRPNGNEWTIIKPKPPIDSP